MIAPPDSSFLFALYSVREQTPRAKAWLARHAAPVALTELQEYEFRVAVQHEIFRHRADPDQGIPEGAAIQLLLDFEHDLDRGIWLPTSFDMSAVLGIATELSEKHTAAFGDRSFDILHVATALHLGAREFLTFDAPQRRLAEAEGLIVPL